MYCCQTVLLSTLKKTLTSFNLVWCCMGQEWHWGVTLAPTYGARVTRQEDHFQLVCRKNGRALAALYITVGLLNGCPMLIIQIWQKFNILVLSMTVLRKRCHSCPALPYRLWLGRSEKEKRWTDVFWAQILFQHYNSFIMLHISNIHISESTLI